jgi:hypothetical protein
MEMKKLLKLMLVGVFMATVGMTLTGCPEDVVNPPTGDMAVQTGDMARPVDLRTGG